MGFELNFAAGRSKLTIIIKADNGDRLRIGGPGNVFSIRAPERFIGAWPGDSGSLVVDVTHGASYGLVFAGDGQSGGLTFACELGAVMAELELETACAGEANALIGGAVLRRMTVAWAAAEVKPSGIAAHTNALVQELVEKTERFRHRYFSEGPNDRADALGSFLRGNAPDLAEALHQDEEFAGLMDRAFGDWLVLPTIYDMLEYRIPDQAGGLPRRHCNGSVSAAGCMRIRIGLR